MSFSLSLAKEQLEKYIQALPIEGKPSSLYEPIRYIMSLEGKRMRPLLTLLGYSLYQDDWQKAIPAAVTTEVFHNFTLLHDDIMDDAPLRRGQPTAHEKWNVNTALLAGDLMLIKVYQWLEEVVPSTHLSIVLRLFNRCAISVCEGQQLDMEFESRAHVRVEEYIEMITLKTAVLLGFALELGAMLGGATAEQGAQLRQVGILVGIGFQLHDDILDVYGSPETFGKRIGGDIIENKKTYMMLKALEIEKSMGKKDLQDWLAQTNFEEDKKIAAVRKIYDELNIRALATQKMDTYFEQAYQQLTNLNVRNNTQKSFLQTFLQQIQKRQK